MPGLQPSWQREPCPLWCIREHGEDDIALDRYHQGPPASLSVAMSTRPDEPHHNNFETVDLTLRVGRFSGEIVDWVAIEPIELTVPRIVLTAESASRLAQRVKEMLAHHAAG
ncbi:hypothetical protein AB3X52_12550 [Nocardioides sp. DS6]|uniref:Uncharacterized protein n=1 Tax=Nocardioides eburneus TaxID=3231482 RepID=A0ABV3SZT7_9ACTN